MSEFYNVLKIIAHVITYLSFLIVSAYVSVCGISNTYIKRDYTIYTIATVIILFIVSR